MHALLGLVPADDQELPRPCRRHIQQPPVFAHLAQSRRFLGGGDLGCLQRFVDAEEDAIIAIEQRFASLMVRDLRGVGQYYNIGFQPLGAVHRHHAHRPAAMLHVAFDVGGAFLEPAQETFQRWRMRTLMRQRQRTTGLVCTPYLESCPRTAPFGKAALWTLT